VAGREISSRGNNISHNLSPNTEFALSTVRFPPKGSNFATPSFLATVLGQKESSDAHFTPKVADFATLPQATIFMRTHKNLAVY